MDPPRRRAHGRGRLVCGWRTLPLPPSDDIAVAVETLEELPLRQLVRRHLAVAVAIDVVEALQDGPRLGAVVAVRSEFRAWLGRNVSRCLPVAQCDLIDPVIGQLACSRAPQLRLRHQPIGDYNVEHRPVADLPTSPSLHHSDTSPRKGRRMPAVIRCWSTGRCPWSSPPGAEGRRSEKRNEPTGLAARRFVHVRSCGTKGIPRFLGQSAIGRRIGRVVPSGRSISIHHRTSFGSGSRPSCGCRSRRATPRRRPGRPWTSCGPRHRSTPEPPTRCRRVGELHLRDGLRRRLRAVHGPGCIRWKGRRSRERRLLTVIMIVVAVVVVVVVGTD